MQVFDEDFAFFGAIWVDGVGQFAGVGADREGADAAEGFAFGQGVLVEQEFFGAVWAFLAAVERVLFSGFVAGVIVIVAVFSGTEASSSLMRAFISTKSVSCSGWVCCMISSR